MLESIDNLIRVMDSQRGVELRLERGRPAQLVMTTGPTDLTPGPLSNQDIAGALGPIVPDHIRRQLTMQTSVEFEYECHGVGSMTVGISRANGGATVSIKKANGKAAETQPLRPSVPSTPLPRPQPQAQPQPAPQPAPQPRPQARPMPTSTVGGPAIDNLFRAMCAANASDLHLSVSAPPLIRKDGHMVPLDETAPRLTRDSLETLVREIMPKKNQEEFERRHDTDFAYEIEDLARFRVNIFMDRKGMGAVFRVIPTEILTAEQLNLSPHILKLCQLSKGLVLVTGPTGSGKSTTLCAMIDFINRTRADHIITIEDPIEFVHENKKCLINQREIHNHTDSFKDALRAALREDPDIVLVGEMRDLETVAIAIETAETGHLVFGTLHTTTAASTVDRVIDQFPADRQAQIRIMLSESLKGVIAQTLCRKIGGGRVAALEVLIVNSAIGNLIRESKTFQIPSMMQTGRGIGMVGLNDALFEHVKNGLVEPQEAYAKSVDKSGFETLLKRGNFDTSFVKASASN